jgi:clan AA aspartic protease (TIGR02281 family)
VPLSTDDLLRPQKRVFTRKRREYGPLSVAVAVVSALVLMLVYASYTGLLVAQAVVMVVAGLLGAVALPWFVARRFRSRGPRLFALMNVVAALVLFLALGRPTDHALASRGLLPFEALAGLVGAEADAPHTVTDLGQGVVTLLRAMTLSGQPGEIEEALEESGEPEPPPVPRAAADVDPGPDGAHAKDAGETDGVEVASDAADAPDPDADEPAGIQATLEDAGPEALGTYTVLATPMAGTVEVPIERHGRTFTVGVLVDGRVPADFVFDTGADYTAITPALARRLGHEPDEVTDRRRFLTAGGPVEDPVVRLERLSIDGAEVRDVEVMICTRCPNNLLGRNFHGRFRVEIDSGVGILRLHPR